MFIHPVHFIIFLTILLLASFGWIFLDARRKRKELKMNAFAGAPAVASLRQRVAVLERIATDPAGRLEKEIDCLRPGN